MPLPPDFPQSPHTIIDPSMRWIPDTTQLPLGGNAALLPPLVSKIRDAVKAWRDDNYKDASETSKALLNWWFKTPHLQEKSDGTMEQFQYYFAQREALETIIYLYDVVKLQDEFDLMRFDSTGSVSAGMFDENWRRFVIKMATGTGKTKVMSLAITWSFFHKLYEPDSELSRNFLVIAPNIIVLDRLYHDFQGLQIFFDDPVLPDNGYEGQNWRNDFQLTLHVQDEVRTTRATGNIFLTNIHRVYSSDQTPPSADDDNSMDYFLGENQGALDIEIPILTRRVYREYKHLADLDVSSLDFKPIVYLSYRVDELREIEFQYMTTSEVAHTTILESPGTEDYRNALGYFAQTLMKELRLVSGYDVLYTKIKEFVQHHLFGETVALDDPVTIKNLAKLRATKTIIETFKRAINELTVQDKGNAALNETTKISSTRPFMVKDQEHLVPTKSVFNIITGDSHLELEFAKLLEECPDVISYAKNYYGVHFKLDYVNADGNISNYYPDFIVKLTDGSVVLVETNGLEDLDVPLKMQRLSQWCEDVNNISSDVTYDFVFVDEESFRTYQPTTFQHLLDGFTEYKAT